MENQGFIGIKLVDSKDNTVNNNEIITQGKSSTGILLERSDNNEISGNKILSTEQIELLNNLSKDVQTLKSTVPNEVVYLLENLEKEIDNVRNAKQDSLLNKAHKLSETITNILTLGTEKAPQIVATLAPYIMSVLQSFGG